MKDNRKTIQILPNEAPLVYQYIGNQFATSQNLTKSGNVYGLSNGATDGHMMKNSEWGAVAYLSHSTYGINKEIAINNYSNYNSTSKTYFKTGCGALDGATYTSKTCTNAYSTEGLTIYPQSTTGNITGIFDMSGGAYEYVMGNYNNVIHEDYIAELPDSKYYDVYLESQFHNNYYYGSDMTLCTLETCGGHALLETAGWYNDRAYFVYSFIPWFTRGGSASDGSYAGAWGSSNSLGGGYNYFSWRSVLVVASGA